MARAGAEPSQGRTARARRQVQAGSAKKVSKAAGQPLRPRLAKGTRPHVGRSELPARVPAVAQQPVTALQAAQPGARPLVALGRQAVVAR